MTKKGNKNVVANSHAKKQDFFALRVISFVCLIGAFSQVMLSFKIIFVDKEFATLALSLVFFIMFGYGYYSSEANLAYRKKDFFIAFLSIAGASLVCAVLMIAFLDMKGEIAVAAVCSLTFSEFLPCSILWIKKEKGMMPNEK
jgi:hypothetical protein